MATASVTNTFANATTADADEVNTNFSDLVTFLNDNVVHRDGSKAMTADLNMGGFNIINLNATNADGFDWQSYTPSWSGASTNPAIGDGTLTGEFIEVGKLIVARIAMTAGSTTTFGSGAWTFGLPVTAAAWTANTVIGSFRITDSGTQNFFGIWEWHNTTEIEPVTLNSDSTRVRYTASDVVSSSVPMTWANGDSLLGTFIYEAA